MSVRWKRNLQWVECGRVRLSLEEARGHSSEVDKAVIAPAMGMSGNG